MYGKAQGVAAATLPATGGMALGFSSGGVWLFLALFTLVVALFAVWRMVPRRES